MNEMKTKRIISVIAAASAVAALFSCNKEESVQAVEPNADGEIVFTASLPACEPASKVSFDVDATNKVVDVLWHENDIIYITDGTLQLTTSGGELKDVATGAAPTAHAVAITLTSDMITDGGKTATITVASGVLDDTVSKWYAFATNYSNAVYRFEKNGSVSSREIASTSPWGNGNMAIPYMAHASCSPDNLSLSFKNAYCYLHYTCNAGTTSYGFAFHGNGTDDVEVWGLSINASSVPSKGSAKTNAFFHSIIGASGTEGYVALAPGVTYANGFTLFATKDSSGNPLDTPFSVKTLKSFTTEAGRYYELGKLNDVVTYDNYYDMWNAGKNITVDGVVYNKATYTATPVHVTSDTTISDETGIYFVDPSATLTVTSWNPNRIIIGNSLTERSKLALNSHFYIGGSQYLLLKNLDITLKHTGNAMFCVTTNAKLTISVDDCYIDNTSQNKPVFTYNGACENPIKLQIVNSEIEFAKAAYSGTLAKLDANGKDASVVLKNTVLYVNGLNTDGRPYGSVMIIGSDGSVLTDLTIDHCTFINVGKTGWKNMDMGGSIQSMTVTNNYGYTTSTATNYWIYFIGATEPASWTFSGNYSTGYNNAFCPQWGTVKTEVSAKVADQFVALDIDTRNFKLKVSEYGAQR